jgi:hypothetical protein
MKRNGSKGDESKMTGMTERNYDENYALSSRRRDVAWQA